ncbi:hypothetical protein [Lacipirellula parvula]|uniref:PEP-CTERM protein-sorting domain-containing protein n=1 Tax=Lacipirellula parvula TaxID=2650471 RepID=A0A5K7XHC7_9BACT|nr:hypothetical protein [Lacipirellula parvula]BBO33686.1 hypothetical protein PLANPX_3298 [Lacipirellula parvula]
MKRSLMWCCALALSTCLAAPELEVAAAPLNLPTATGLAPGDLLISDFFNGWIKFDPSSNQLYSLPWPTLLGAPKNLAIDVDGSILFKGRLDSIDRLNPRTGTSAPLTPPASTPLLGVNFSMLPDGDLLLFQQTTSASRNGDVWTGGTDSVFARFDRASGTISPIPIPNQFVPRQVAIGVNGEVYVNEFFRGVQRIDLMTGEMSQYPQAQLGFTSLLGVSPNDDLITYNFVDGIVRFNPETNVNTTIKAGSLFGAAPLAVDEHGDIWVNDASDGLTLIDGSTGETSLLLPRTSFFSPQAMIVIPSNWTPPPVPEPTTLALAISAYGGLCLITLRSRRPGRAYTRSAP